MKFTYKQIKKSIKDLGLLELYDLESTIKKEFIKRGFESDNYNLLKNVRKYKQIYIPSTNTFIDFPIKKKKVRK